MSTAIYRTTRPRHRDGRRGLVVPRGTERGGRPHRGKYLPWVQFGAIPTKGGGGSPCVAWVVACSRNPTLYTCISISIFYPTYYYYIYFLL